MLPLSRKAMVSRDPSRVRIIIRAELHPREEPLFSLARGKCRSSTSKPLLRISHQYAAQPGLLKLARLWAGGMARQAAVPQPMTVQSSGPTRGKRELIAGGPLPSAHVCEVCVYMHAKQVQ